jgi:hypothetical protein
LVSTTDDANFFVLPDIGSEIADLEKKSFAEYKRKNPGKKESLCAILL